MIRRTHLLTLTTAVLFGVLCIACGARVTTNAPGAGSGQKYTLTSAEFCKEFNDNLSSALQKYGNNEVELTGKLLVVGYDNEGKPRFYLEGHPPGGNTWVACFMTDRFPWTKANPLQTVTVKGKGHPAFARQLTDCQLVKATGDPAPRFTADEFAARANDPEKLKNKTNQSAFIVSGKISERKPLSATSAVYLDTKDGKGVLVQFAVEDATRLKLTSWRAGQQIEAIGNDSTNPGSAWLVNCVLMADPK